MARILWLSTGLFKDRYGQQNYESICLKSIYEYCKPQASLDVFLLNDLCFPEDWALPALRFICFGKPPHQNLWCWGKFLSRLKFVLSFFRNILKERPGLVICGHINLSFLCVIASRIFKTKFALLAYGKEVWDIKGKMKLKALHKAQCIIAMSEHTAAKIKSQIIQNKNNIFVIPAYIDTDKFFPAPKPPDLVEKYGLGGSKVLLTVSRLWSIEYKGYLNVIRALPLVMKVFPEIKYIIVGAGDDIPNILKLTAELNLDGRVIITGFVNHQDLNPYYNLCDCFIMPSKQEGFGLVFLEALACGKPVIAGNQDGSRHALIEGKLGALVDPDNAAQIAQAIIKFLKGEVEGRFLDRDFLRKSVMAHFGPEKFHSRVKELMSYIESN